MDTIQAIGGDGPQKMVIGGRAQFQNMDARDKWMAHKRLGKSEFTIKTINEILALPEYIEDEALLKEVLTQIWDAPNEQIFNGLVKSLELNEPTVVARRTMFWKLKELIESVIMLHLKYVQDQNVKQLAAEWRNYVRQNEIDTSSVILWSNFGKESPNQGKYFKSIDFDYLGYCPHVPNDRIRALLQFPVDVLIGEIRRAAPKLNLDALKFKKLHTMLLEQINPAPVPSGVVNCKRPTIKKTTTRRAYLKAFMDAWLEFNDCLKPYLEEQEHYYVAVAKKMDAISAELEKINGQLLELIGSN